jgi:hypothetical protein
MQASAKLVGFEEGWAEFEAKLADRVVQFTRTVYIDLVANSPQWSQNLASNWNYAVGSPNYNYVEHPNKPNWRKMAPFQRGDGPVVSDTISKMQAKAGPKWGEKTFITNATPYDKGGYLQDSVEAGRVLLRPVNLVQGQQQLFGYIMNKYESYKL